MRAHDEGGFTLVELLVSLALLAMTAALLLAAVTTGHGIERRAATAALAGESVAAAHGVLRDRIAAMIPEPILGGGVPTIDVRGTDDSLRFTAPLAEAQRPGPPAAFRLLLTRAGELSLFHIDPLSTRGDPDGVGVAGWTRDPLIGNVARLEIDYFGAGPPDHQRRWRNRWTEQPRLPELVRVRLAFARGDTRVWPDLIVRPAATISPACQLDQVTGQCRIGPA